MNKKKIFRWSHLWLGLISALILFIMALTGTIFVYADEITDHIAGEAKQVSIPANATPQTADALFKDFRQQCPNNKVLYFDFYRSPNRSVRVASKDTLNGVSYYNYIDPYTGKVLKRTRALQFFSKTLEFHRRLLMGNAGATLVGLATLIFLIEVISGIIIWIPKRWTKQASKNAFLMKKNPTLKRFNYDLHKVVSFYILIPAVILSVTGLVMAFHVCDACLQTLWGGDPHFSSTVKQLLPTKDDDRKTVALADVVNTCKEAFPHTLQTRIIMPKGNVAAFRIKTGDYIGIVNRMGGAESYIDAYTAKKINMPEKVERSFNINAMNVNIHTFAWGGWITKLILFITGLICTTLPITGFIIWWGKRRARKHKG